MFISQDTMSEDDLLGHATFVFDSYDQPTPQHHHHQQLQQHQQHQAQQQQHQQRERQPQQPQQPPISGSSILPLTLETPHVLRSQQAPSWRKSEGAVLEVELSYTPSSSPGEPTLSGPVRFRQHLSLLAGGCRVAATVGAELHLLVLCAVLCLWALGLP